MHLVLEIVLSTNIGVCVCFPALIKSYVEGTHNNRIMAFLFLYMTLAIDKLNGCGLSNTVCYENLPTKTKVM